MTATVASHLMHWTIVPDIVLEYFQGTTQKALSRIWRYYSNNMDFRRLFCPIMVANLQEWRVKYNEVRPHEAIDMRCPADVYIPSERKYQPTIKPYEYSGIHRVLKVNYKGYLRFDRKEFYLSETMTGAELELQPIGGTLAWLCYRNYKIAEIDLATEQLLNRRISRLQ